MHNMPVIDSLPNFNIVDPMESVTKIGAGANLYMVVEVNKNMVLIPAGNLPLRDVANMSVEGKKLIEIVR